jgi:hypothetical protein
MAVEKRFEKPSDQLQIAIRARILHLREAVKFAEIVAAFPETHPLTLISAVTELEKQTVLSFSICHNSIFVGKLS